MFSPLQIFYHDHLKDYGYGNDTQKQLVAMDPFADVLLHELSSIKLIEDLAKDESIEDQGIPHLLTHIEY